MRQERKEDHDFCVNSGYFHKCLCLLLSSAQWEEEEGPPSKIER